MGVRKFGGRSLAHDAFDREVRLRRIAVRLRGRLAAFAWLAGAGITHVPLGTAARVLGVTKARVRQLVAAGRLPVHVLPGGAAADRFIPVSALLACNTPLETGHPLGWRKAKKDADADAADRKG